MKKFIIEEQDCFIKTNGIIRLPHSLKYGEQAVSVCPKHKLAPLKTSLDWFRVTHITPLPATSCHDCANPLFDTQSPFILRPKPSINIKNSIDNGSIDFSERGV